MSNSQLSQASAIDGSPPSSRSTRIPPRLPFELVSEIIKEARREDLPAVHATSRMFREITRPFLFRDLTFTSVCGVKDSLLNIAQCSELAALVRSLAISITQTPLNESGRSNTILNDLAVAISLLSELETFRLEKFPRNLLVLNERLEHAVLLHPTLWLFAYDRWLSSLNPYDVSFTRTRSHPLIIEHVAFNEDAFRTSNSLGFHELYETITSFVHHHHLHIHHLDLKGYDEEDGFPLPFLLSNPLTGLVVLTLGTFSSHEFFPELLTSTDWLSLFVKAHPSLRRVEFVGTLDPRRTHDYGLIFLPWPAFSHIDGLEGLSNEDHIPWTELGAMEHLVLDLSPEGGRELVTLAFERVTFFEDEAPELEVKTIEALVSAFPNLKELGIGGKFRTPQVAQSIAALAGFSSLSAVRIPFDLSSVYYPELDHDDVEYILHELEDEHSQDARDMTASERDLVRHRILTSGIHRKRTLAYYVAPFEDEWRRLFASSSSLEELEWVVYAGDELQGSLACGRDEMDSTKSIFGARSKEVLEREPPGHEWREWEDLIEWVFSGPPLFKEEPDFVPAFTLDRFVTRSS